MIGTYPKGSISLDVQGPAQTMTDFATISSVLGAWPIGPSNNFTLTEKSVSGMIRFTGQLSLITPPFLTKDC